MKYALIIGNNKYDDPKLAQLKTPAADSAALAKVLDDQSIGSFDEVTSLINQSETKVRRAVSSFLTDKKPDDLVLLYFSGHGVLDDRGRLYLALKDTQVNLLKATSIPSSFVADEMDSCRSRRQILVLDCCHSGAFARGTKGQQAQKAITETTFEGSGFGRVVLTASDSTQYALEGDQVIKQTELSLFTHFLLEGLKTGEADMNNDGHISLDEWYDYTYTKVVAETPRQVPHKWSYNQQGDLVIARNPFLKKKTVELPYELIQALESPFVGIRESAVIEVGKYLKSRDSEMVSLAIASLEKMKNDDSRRISSLAEKLISDVEQSRVPVKNEIASEASAIPEMKSTSDSPEGSVIDSQHATSRIRIPEMHLPRPTVHKEGSSSGLQQDTSQRIVLNRLFWLKWIGTIVLGTAFSIGIYSYQASNSDFIGTVPTLFGMTAGLTSLAQWFFFRNRLELWWIPVNIITGIGLGLFHKYMFENTGWGLDDLLPLLVTWLILNFLFGIILQRRTTEPFSESSSFINIGARHNIFLMFLLISLIVGSVSNILLIQESWDYLHISWIVYGISAILASIVFFIRKETPRSFGFIALALFLLFDGYNVERLAFDSSYLLSYFYLSGTLSFVSGIFFISKREAWKNFGFIALAGYLISNGISNFYITSTDVGYTFLGISTLFGILATIYLLFRG